jgi:hypothetical protein
VIGVVGVVLTGVSLEFGWRRRRRTDSGAQAKSR